MRHFTALIVVSLGLVTGTASHASAQSPPVGVRAAGMGGAFTAVADDGTAAFWNPAGLASGAFVGVTADVNLLDTQSAQFAGLVTPPFGINYFRETHSSTVDDASGRNAAVVPLAVHHAGATVVQSIGDTGLAVGVTAGLVHGNGANAFDADAGLMLAGALGKIGLTVHNLTAPMLGDVRLERRWRAGISLNLGPDVTAAADVELTAIPSPAGDWREAATGVEAHVHPRVWVRSGVHWNTAGSAAAPIMSVGSSIELYGSLRADAQASFGSQDGNRGWGVGLSFVY
jgi:hypothetical protein